MPFPKFIMKLSKLSILIQWDGQLFDLKYVAIIENNIFEYLNMDSKGFNIKRKIIEELKMTYMSLEMKVFKL